MHSITQRTTTPAAPARDVVLDGLLDAELDFDPVARQGFINHLAMGLVAARRLGAGDEELAQSYRDTTSGSFLVPRERPDGLEPLTEEVRRRGARVVAAEHLTDLVAAPGSQFFHAVIRLELALDADHPGQVANALQNWSAHLRPLGRVPEPTGSRTFVEVLDALDHLARKGTVDATDLHALAASPAFRDTIDSLDVADDLDVLDQVAAAAAAAHARASNFTTLHLVTGTRAVRAMSQLTTPVTRRELTVRTAQAVAATWLSAGSPELADGEMAAAMRDAAPDDWADIGRLAVRSGDPHVVKLVYASCLEHDTTGDPIYRWLAAHQVGRV